MDAGVCIQSHDRAGLEPLRKAGSELVYRGAKQHSEPPIDKRSTRADELRLTPLELIDRIAALVPPPRTRRHRYFGGASNSPLSAVVTAMAQAAPAQDTTVRAEPAVTEAGAPSAASLGIAAAPTPEAAQPKRAAHHLWAVRIARIYEVFPLLCPMCGGQMRIIAFITHSADIRRILDHIEVASKPPRIGSARGPPLWQDCDAQKGDGVQVEPDWGLAAQPAADYEVEQRMNF